MNGSGFQMQWAPRMLSIIRIVAAFMLMQHGGQKLFGYPPSAHPMPHPLPPLMLVAGILEFFGGLLLLIGLFTRPVAFILAGEMATAFFMMHVPRGLWTVNNMGEPACSTASSFFIWRWLGVGRGALIACGAGVRKLDFQICYIRKAWRIRMPSLPSSGFAYQQPAT